MISDPLECGSSLPLSPTGRFQSGSELPHSKAVSLATQHQLSGINLVAQTGEEVVE